MATALLLATAIPATVYVRGLPQLIASLLSRSVAEPDSEDYAVYSAFVDDLFTSDEPGADQSLDHQEVVYVAGETPENISPTSVPPLDVAALGPIDMGEDFFRQNAHTWRLQPRLHTRWGIQVGSETSHRTGFSSNDPQFSCVLRLSRIGFDQRRRLALLYYSYRCGPLCCSSRWVVLHKTEGNWRIKQFGPGRIY